MTLTAGDIRNLCCCVAADVGDLGYSGSSRAVDGKWKTSDLVVSLFRAKHARMLSLDVIWERRGQGVPLIKQAYLHPTSYRTELESTLFMLKTLLTQFSNIK